jgi:microcystin-dependent protein
MSQQYVGEIRIFSFNFAPRGWALCNGQTLPIQQNVALFSLLGTFYGGNGTTNFQLPDLRGRVAIGYGNGSSGSYNIGELGGEPNHTLTINEMPMHNHLVNFPTAAGTQKSPIAGIPATPEAAVGNIYAAGPATIPMAPQTIQNAGGSLPHNNLQPYTVLTCCIALVGIFPSRN